MAKAKIKPNSGGILSVLNSSEIVDALYEAAETIATRAQASAPVESGEYRDSIHVESGDGYDRPVAYVVADAEHSLAVEAKTANLLKAAMGGGADE